MRLVLSRKGFDSEYGGVPSPVLPDGTLRPLPIPYPSGSRSFADFGGPAPTAAHLVRDLTRGRLTAAAPAHLDPDLAWHTVERPPGWRPAFGQASLAQRHLARCGVGPGDLFLFFGWFRRVELAGDAWRYVRGARDEHVIWGWLQVAGIHAAHVGAHAPAGLDGHEHFRTDLGDASIVYEAAERLTLSGASVPGVPGAGVVRRWRSDLVLTAPGPDATRSHWQLPAWFAPAPGRRALTYHRNPAAWRPAGEYVRLRTVGKGQEFVLDTAEYPEALPWLRTLLAPEGDST